MKKIYPLKYSEYVEKYSEEYNIDKYLVYAIIKAESNFKENAKSTSNAVGLMQIMEATAFETAKKMDLKIIILILQLRMNLYPMHLLIL